jgi:hypothetical protein
MSNKRTISFLTPALTLLFLCLLTIVSTGQNTAKLNAIQQFNQGNFMEVLPVFEKLIQEQPEDFLLNYYYGATRTETKHFSENDLKFLEKALEGSPPQKINYYLAVQYQALNKWTQALRFYNKFQLIASEDERKKLLIAQRIQQCFNQENPFDLKDSTTELSNQTLKQDSLLATKTDTIQKNELTSIKDSAEFTAAKNQNIVFPVNSQITYFSTSNFKTKEGLEQFLKSEDLKTQLDETAKEMESLRSEYSETNNMNEKKSIGNKILELEKNALKIRNEVNTLLSKVITLENNYWQKASQQETEAFKTRTNWYFTEQNENVEISIANNDSTSKTAEIYINPELLLEEPEQLNPLATEEKVEDELIYKIQIGAYSRGLPTYVQRLFNKLSLIRKIDNYTDENGVVVYTTGNLQNIEDAVKMRDQVRQEGAEDAFVVPYFKGKRITLEEAKKLETGS